MLAGGAAVALLARSVLDRDAMQLQICMEVERPFLAWPCRQALYRLHPTAAEIRDMNRSAGAQFVVFMEDRAEARRLLSHYLNAGLDINAQDHRDALASGESRGNPHWTALHLAATALDENAVPLLLDNKANPAVKDDTGRTPLDLAKAAAAKQSPDQRNTAVIELLESAGSKR
ncbi:hypothetical protein [Variovorax rhizosphaerae]|uniref:Ankyrin repeat domain-containing protein n=1 Tax=Variovorax rhizosphaerae TaxID=1836200 RepID=A0ABU8WW85_9BURK